MANAALRKNLLASSSSSNTLLLCSSSIPGRARSRSSSGNTSDQGNAGTWALLVCLTLMTFWMYKQQATGGPAGLSAAQQLPVGWCMSTKQKPAVALLMLILGHEEEARHDPYWMAVANRRAYSIEHSYPLYLVDQPLGSGQHPAWEKLIAVEAVFQHSCADWVWMSDADAYILNLQRDIAALGRHPLQHRHPERHCNTSRPDIIAAGSCLTHINTGSLLLRNNDWTQQFVADAWHSKFIARPANWWDQAAVLHLYKIGNNKQHVCIVKQHALNAMPYGTGCHDGFGTYSEGDLLVHFPGGMKSQITSMASPWLQAVPILPSKLEDATARAKMFVVSGYDAELHAGLSSGHRLHIPMYSSLYAAQSDMGTDFEIFIEAQPEEEAVNLGWPVAPAPAEFKALVRRQLVVRRDDAWRQLISW